MKESIKPILLIVLAIMLAVTIIVPTRTYAGDTVHMPGYKGQGPFGDTCWCPSFAHINCGCAITDPNG